MRVISGTGLSCGTSDAGRLTRWCDHDSNVATLDKIVWLFDAPPQPADLAVAHEDVRTTACVVRHCSAYSHSAWAISYFGLHALSIGDEPLPTAARCVVDGSGDRILIAENAPDEGALCERSSAPYAINERPQSTVRVLAQIQSVEDIQIALDAGADGVGELKSEISFRASGRAEWADSDLVAALHQVDAWHEIPVRFFDFSLDKRTTGPRAPYQGPLGLRGPRILAKHPHLLETFRRLCHRADPDRLIVMLPMVSTADEVSEFRDRCGAWHPTIGVTIETPAAAILAQEVLQQCRYVDIGLHDLTQFTLGWSRDVPSPSLPADDLHPAVAALIRRTLGAAHTRMVPCPVTLDLRPSTGLARRLAACGATAVTVSPRLVGHWRRAFANIDAADEPSLHAGSASP